MDNKIEQLKKDLVQEIKDLAQALANADSYVGLLSNEIKFRALQEKFIVLKFLEQKKLNLEVFNFPIPTQKEKQEILEQDGAYEDEKPVVFDFEVEDNQPHPAKSLAEVKNEVTEEELDQEVEKVLEKAESLLAVNQHLAPKEEQLPAEEETIDKENAEYDQQDHEEEKKTWKEDIYNSLNYDEVQAESSMPNPIKIDFNDKIAFLNQLFLNDEESMNLVIDTLNRISDIRSSNQYLEDLKREMGWHGAQEEYFERLRELVLNRFK